MLPYSAQAWSVAVVALVMGFITCAVLRVIQLLAGISELEEHSSVPDEVRTKAVVPASPSVSRSLQATPEKQRDPPVPRSRRRRSGRRSLSLPTGSLSYGDVKITYRDGHFVTEPIAGSSEVAGDIDVDTVSLGGSSSKPRYDRKNSDPTALLCGNLMNINSEEEMREEILSLLERGLSTEDISLLFSQYLDLNSNHLNVNGTGDSSATTSSSTAAGLVSSLPRRHRNRGDGTSRPISVDEVKLWQQLSQSEQSLVSEGVEEANARRKSSLSETLEMSDTKGSVAETATGNEASMLRLSRQTAEDKGRSHRPGFIQRMLQKRKSFSDKTTSSARSQKDDVASAAAASTRKDARESVMKKVSIKGIFRRKNSITNADLKKDLDEPGSPPIATFMNDDDIAAVSSLPSSPLTGKHARRVKSDSQFQPLEGEMNLNISIEKLNSSLDSIVIAASSDKFVNSANAALSERSSGEYSLSEYDYGSECRSSEDTLTPRSLSPSNTSSLTLDGDVTLTNMTSERDLTLCVSPRSLDRTLGSVGGSQQTPGRKPPLPKQELDKLASIVRGEMGSSNSNDSGIQHDVAFTSSNESLKISPEIARQLNSAVKLRNSPSPKQERPKSDFTVRWADLLEQVKETNVTYRHEGNKLRRRPRPKSDLGGSSLLSETDMRPAFGGTTGSLGTGGLAGPIGYGASLQQCDSILSLVELRRPGNRGRLDFASLQAARLAKSRRMSTPQPIKTRTEKIVPQQLQKRVTLIRSYSMPENLDRLRRKKNYFSLIGSDMHSIHSNHSGGDDSSDESEFSMDYHHEKSLSTRASRVTLATLDHMIEEENLTYAEALWDHVTMDPDELGFRAGDLIRVTETADKHWWYGTTEHHDGWFPAAFVRLRVNQDNLEAEMTLSIQEEEEEIQHQQPPLTSNANKTQFRANVINEIITAETEYVKHLRDVIEGYVKQAQKRPEMFPVEKVSVIFSNIEEIYDFATNLLSELQATLNQAQPHLTEFGKCFLNKTHRFEIYSEYCNNHPAACEELRELYRVKRYRHFFEACRLLQEMTEIPLEGFLLTPVQKICKYHLQLAELLKYTAPEHPDFPHVQAAVDAMKKIATLVNERKRKMESIEKLASWQLLVDDWEGPDILEVSSELIYSGELNKINANGWSQERYFFLFDHQLVYCKKDLLKKNSFGYKGRINMDHSEIICLPDGRDLQYNVTVRNGFKIHDLHRNKWYLIVAKTPQIKQRWLKAFSDERRRVQEDQENNFNIPVHLKQTVISNLKQKSNVNKSKGKRKATRSTSMRASKNESWVSGAATLPRMPRKTSGKPVHSSPTHQSNKLMAFLLGGRKK